MSRNEYKVYCKKCGALLETTEIEGEHSLRGVGADYAKDHKCIKKTYKTGREAGHPLPTGNTVTRIQEEEN